MRPCLKIESINSAAAAVYVMIYRCEFALGWCPGRLLVVQLSKWVAALVAWGSLAPSLWKWARTWTPPKNLILQTPRTLRFYLLPKIHKERNPGRPIVSACNYPTENIASYLDMVMSPLVCNLKTYVKDTDHALQTFRTIQFDNDDSSQRFLCTMDIKSLYTVIPHNSGLEALKYFLSTNLKENAGKVKSVFVIRAAL